MASYLATSRMCEGTLIENKQPGADMMATANRTGQPDLRICPACGESRFRTRVWGGNDYSILECTNCQLAQTIPAAWVTTADYDRAPEHAQRYAKRDHLSREYAEKFIQWLLPYIHSGRMLDIGCSVGVLVDVGRQLGFIGDGIDLDHNAIVYGQSVGRSVNHCGLADWYGKDYDLICLQHTLEHVLEPIGFLESCRGRVKPGGAIAISVPCHDGLHPRLFGKRWYGWQSNQHFLHYSADSLTLMLRKAGFEVLAVQQNSMDHRSSLRIFPLRQSAKTYIMRLVAKLGDLSGRGDQLFAIGRRPVLE